MKQATLREWQELGKECKEINNRLVHLVVQAGEMMPNKDLSILLLASNAFSRFKCHAEGVMFHQLRHTGSASIDIFYGK